MTPGWGGRHLRACCGAPALQPSAEFVLILATSSTSERREPGFAATPPSANCLAGAANDGGSMEQADGSVASGGMPYADPHRNYSGYALNRTELLTPGWHRYPA